jgi:hypothetical protein
MRGLLCEAAMTIKSTDICAAAEQLKGLVGFNRKTHQYIVRFSEDSFGMDVDEASIMPASEFVWRATEGEVMALKRERLQILLNQHVDDRLQISQPLRLYMQRHDLPEILAQRSRQ